MATLIKTALKLTDALNHEYGTHILISSSKFFSEEDKRPITIYVVEDSYKSHGKFIRDELFRSTSGAYVVFFLRDLLYSMEGKDVPEDGEGSIFDGWKRVKERKGLQKSIEFIKEKYLNAHEFSSDS